MKEFFGRKDDKGFFLLTITCILMSLNLNSETSDTAALILENSMIYILLK